ncbi:MAG TPA: sulfite exporter TauE/SafE family protein [Patescibacteria group bacterium]|nr:sulfite exporter TauE/SafE family protein [Patescibacteria group bacterium]
MPDPGIVALLIAGGIGAGIFGSLLGLGGGVLIVPLLTLGFGLPLREAVGVSLVAVIVTSSASAGVYLERHLANLRLGMTLELFTATGALVGGLVAFALSEQVLAGLFTVLLVYTAFTMARRRDAPIAAVATDDETPARFGALTVDPPGSADAPSATAESTGRATAAAEPPPYAVRNLGRGIVGSLFAGVVSALLGIGGGLIKVPLMNLAMGVPLRVATATSNMMIGITASASAIIYLLRGGIDPYVAGPTAVGVFVGASIGSRTAQRVDVRVLRLLFVVVLLITAWQMAARAFR